MHLDVATPIFAFVSFLFFCGIGIVFVIYLVVKNYKSNTYCNEVEILGESKVIYSPDKLLSCGARCWIETEADVVMIK